MDTHEPLPSATVYINGTTKGTITDLNGSFELKDVSLPADVVVSFVGYQIQAVYLDHSPDNLLVELKTNDKLPEVVIEDKNERENIMRYFRRLLLGDDYWAANATIKNEDVLVFKTEGSILHAWANEPLIIDLPLLGYELHLSMVRFEAERKDFKDRCNMIGYFFYMPNMPDKRIKERKIIKNRQTAYYNSSQHFLKSLFDNKLEENGYRAHILETADDENQSGAVIDFSQHIIRIDDNQMQIVGLKGKSLLIEYLSKNNVPMNLRVNDKKPYDISESRVTFLQDTCTVFQGGRVVDNSLIFSFDIAKKRVAASLPSDYDPATLGPVAFAGNVSSSKDEATRELMRFAGNIQQFNSIFPQEKVYLEFDNTAYFQGDVIWFKAFVTHATTLRYAPSKVLYVDLLAPNGDIIRRQKLKVVAGQADGAFALWVTGTAQTREKYGVVEYPSGFYEIRAYTQNMLDFSHEAIFSRVLPVYAKPTREGDYSHSKVLPKDENKLLADHRGGNESNKTDDRINLSFYPEGGSLIAGLPCNVAFKAIGPNGLAQDGAIVFRNRTDTVYTVHEGMGQFTIVPDGNETVLFLSDDGQSHRFSLPQSVRSGYSMIASATSDTLCTVQLRHTADLSAQHIGMAVTCRGDLVDFLEINDCPADTTLNIDCSGWPLGVCRMTFYDQNGRILTSRSLFHNNSKFISPTITLFTDSLTNDPCGKEVLSFLLTDKDGNPIRNRFCLSVRDAADYGTGFSDNLMTNLLLSSDLKGYIHDPEWYLEQDDDEHRTALNLLTLVQGWERYEWQYMTGLEKFTERHRVEDSLTINGWVLSYFKREPVSNIDVYAAVVPYDDKSKFGSFIYHTDSTGYFGCDMLDFYGKANLKIHLKKNKKHGKSKNPTKIRIRLERAEKPAPRPIQKEEMDLSMVKPQQKTSDFSDDMLPEEIRKKMGIVLDDVDVIETDKIPFLDYDTFTAWNSLEDTEDELDMGDFSPTIWDYLEEKGFIIIEDGYKYYMAFGKGAAYPIRFYLHHNTKLASGNLFRTPTLLIDMVDVKSILIYDEPMYERDIKRLCPLEEAYYRERGEMEWFFSDDSTALIRSYLIDVHVKEELELMKYKDIRNLSVRKTTFDGYSKPVEFYAPEYPEGPIEGKKDIRRTLYWNPNVITNADGRARVEFYNNSYSQHYTISGAGITGSGIPYILQQDW